MFDDHHWTESLFSKDFVYIEIFETKQTKVWETKKSRMKRHTHREREREREKRGRETERQSDRERQRDGETERQRDRETYWERLISQIIISSN